MKKLITLFLGILILSSGILTAQDKIIKISYQSVPLSQYNLSEEDRTSSNSSQTKEDLLGNIKDYYSLYIHLKDRSSFYKLDSTYQEALDNGASVSLADKIQFSVKTPDKKTLKYETVFNQLFFSKGEVGDIQWELTNEEKVINGLKCFKAKSKQREYMLTAWYTKEVPVSNGPAIYQGLPGLVVWVEDFFRTTQVVDVTYLDNTIKYKEEYQGFIDEFNKKENKKHYEKEPLLIVKKSDAANKLYSLIHGQRY